MLILQRYAGQSISIGKDIHITVLGQFRGATRISIVAPPEVKIAMDEIKAKKLEYNPGERHD